MRSRMSVCITVMGTLAVLAIPVRSDAEGPSFTVFDAPGAGSAPDSYTGTYAGGINLGGTITGGVVDKNSVYHGFVRSPGGHITTFDAPGSGMVAGSSQGTEGVDINVEGVITGDFQDASYLYHGFVRSPSGHITTFDAPGAGTDGSKAQGTFPSAINADGKIAGYFRDAANVFHGFVRSQNGKFTTFDVPGAGTAPYQGTIVQPISSINPDGDLAGQFIDQNYVRHGYLRTAEGRITTFDAPGAGTDGRQGQGTIGHSINPQGEISGAVIDGNDIYHGFVRTHDGKFKTYDAPGAGSTPGSGEGTNGWQHNSRGLTAGTWWDSYFGSHGYVRTGSGAITVFDAPGAGSAQFSGQGTTTQGLNDRGAISGTILDANNVYHAFVRNPQTN